ncbi:c-type cytochrome [Zoogloea sp.]|uniref:c-type cytochrome n=1 Tax=Zoogloea sp. TaxID=49181 RepID=UPI0026327334|nr:c-type cytochrome [uncultured Zoogloea sp.]
MQKPSTCARPPWPQLLGCALAVTLTACGGGGGGGSAGTSAPASATTLSGTAVDGYLQGARVLLDVNGNGLADAGEPTATTDANGRYRLDYSTLSSPIAGMRVVVTGGVDTDTGNAFTGMLTARADGAQAGQLVSPLTSLVDALVAEGFSLDAARLKVASALGLSVADLATDPVAALASQPVLYTRQVALQRAVQLLASAEQGSDTAYVAQEKVLRKLAIVIVAQSSPATVGELVARANLSQASAGRDLADAVEDALNEALRSQGGRASAKASLKAMDQIRVEMESSRDYSLGRAATRLDERNGGSAYSGLAGSVGKAEAINTFTRRAGTATTVSQPASTAGRLLASNCFQCHGTGGVGGFDRIRGSDAAEVRDYLRKPARSDIMAAHAQGYTSAQLDAIIAYLKQ